MSQTKENLLRAFAGESQARNRYEMAATVAKKQKLPVLQAVFQFTADQEKQHAIVFYDHLKQIFKEENISIDANYPVDIQDDLSYLLNQAANHEDEEATSIYQEFGQQAQKEGYSEVASSFFLIAEIEAFHRDRFKKYQEYHDTGKLFNGEQTQRWMCLNCGFIYEGATAPQKCPVCKQEQGFFIRLEEAPFHK